MRHIPALDGRKLLTAAGIVLAALLVREWHVLASTVIEPTRGDVAQYMRYAIHWALDGTFSDALDGQPVTPDAYRSPGYPFFVALLYSPDWALWFSRVGHAQAVLGAATVGLVIMAGHAFMPFRWAACAGLLLAFQPHHIAASSVMLSEVWLGFLLAAGITAAVYGRGWVAGAFMGAAYLTNPVAALLPLALLPALWGRKREWLAMVAVTFLAIGGWSARNAYHGLEGGDRAGVNLVQGAWPDYHVAAKRWPLRPDYKVVMDRMEAESALIRQDTAAGVRSVASRIAEEPGRFALWYAAEKPYLLWAWDIKMGAGGIYTHHHRGSPLDGGLWLVTALQWAITPLLFGLSLLGCALARGPSRVVAIAFLYFTAIHVVFQAEPRYATAYRWAEVMLAAYALGGIASRIDARNLRIRQRPVVCLEVVDPAPGRV